MTSTATEALQLSGPVARRPRWPILALLLPALVLVVLVFGLPLGWIVRMSLNGAEPGGRIVDAVTASNYVDVLTDAFSLELIVRTLWLGVLVTAFAFLLGYPLALFLVRTTSRWKGILFALALAPLLTSAVVRTFGWIVLLGNDGVVNGALRAIGLIERPLPLANSMTGVVIALVEILLPYMVLAVATGSSRLGDAVLEASAVLGASRWTTFTRVTLPLTLPGILTGCLLVFVLTISSFITPALVGGGRVFVLATEIYNQALGTLNWPLAAAMSVILIVLFGGVLVLYQILMRRLDWERDS